jgi:cytochrome c biogenesis protein CcdA
MASEMRRMAKGLVETRSESFATRHPAEESKARLAGAIEARKPRLSIVETRWTDGDGGPRLELVSRPARAIRRFLFGCSFALTMLVISSAWVMLAPGEPTPLKFLLLLVTALGILGLPLLIVALGSQREAEDERLRRAIRHALLDEPEFPRPLRDED